MLRLFKNLKPMQLLLIVFGVGFITLQVYLDLLLPDYMNEITQLLQLPNSQMSDIWINGGYMLLCALGSGLLSVVVGFIAAFVAAGFSKTLRAKLFHKVEHFSLAEMQQFSTPSLITRSTNDITQIQRTIAMGLQILIKGPILAVWAIAKILDKSWQWSAATAVALGVLFLLIGVIILFALPKFKRIQSLTDDLNNVTRENLTGIRVVRAYNAETYEEQKFETANQNLTSTQLFTSRLMAIMQPGMSLITGGLNLAIYWIGAILIENAIITAKIGVFGDMVVFSSYAMQIVFAFVMMTMIFIMLPRATVSAKRILEVLSTKSQIQDGTKTPTGNKVGEIEFKDVCFKYPGADEYVLKNISFVANKGQTVAFIGSTGSGKSTLINLLPRFYDATEGQILIDGLDVKDYTQEQLHDKLGYIPQHANLFSGTIESNLTFGQKNGKKPTKQDVETALVVAQAGFVNQLQDKTESVVAQGGTNFSGGQKQRLSIARAVARKPEVYIFDDSFSALDYKTDRNLRKALKEYNAGITNLIVAQRIGTIKDADKIIVLDDGEIVGQGTHKELLKSCKVYQEIASSQLSKEELSYE